MQEEKQKDSYFCISSCMRKRLLFWLIYTICIFIIYLLVYPQPSERQEVGIKQSTFKLIKQFEGVSKTPYDDGFGNYTIGVGHHIKPDEAHLYYSTLTTKQVDTLLKRDMAPCERVIKDEVGHPLTQGQFDALMSLCFNIGKDNFARSEVMRHLNRGNYHKAAQAMLNWNRPQELVPRRKHEAKLFLNGA